MIRIAISGKANSGKNTVSMMICEELSYKYHKIYGDFSYENIAFAAPIKAIIRLMFPELPEKFITGSSKFRSEIISGAFKNGKPLTVRQLHTDIGTSLGRSYNENIWIEAFDKTYQKIKDERNLIIVPDVRMINEFNYLKALGFYQIRLLRSNLDMINNIAETSQNHITEIQQDSIKDEEFDFILNNNDSLDVLKQEVIKIINQIS